MTSAMDAPLHAEQLLERNVAFEGPFVSAIEQNNTASNEDEDQGSQLYDRANSIFEECKNAAPLFELDTAISLFRDALRQQPAPHPLRSDSLKDLAGGLTTRFSLTNKREDLDQSLLLRNEIRHESSNTVTDAGGPSQLDRNILPEYKMAAGQNTELSELRELAKTTIVNFNQSTRLSSLDTAISLYRQAILLRRSPHHQWLASLGGLAEALYARFRRAENITDLDEAISVVRQALEVCPESHVYRVDLVNHISALLATRFDKTNQSLDLQEVITRRRDVFQVADSDDGGEACRLLYFAANPFKQFNQSGQMADLETAISLLREGLAFLPDHHPDRPPAYDNLANALAARFDQSGRHKDLDESISLHHDALRLRPVPNPNRSISLINLGGNLARRFDLSGQPHDLDEAIAMLREAFKISSVSDPHRSDVMNNLAVALRKRFEQSGQHADLDDGISLLQETLQLRPAPNPKRPSSLINLAAALARRSELLGQRRDLEEAIRINREVLAIYPTSHPYRSDALHNLAFSLLTSFEKHSGKQENLDESILLSRETLELCLALHPKRYLFMANLAGALTYRFGQFGQLQDIDESILLSKEALELCPGSHPGRPISLVNLASALGRRFEHSGQRQDLDGEISLYREALKMLPISHLNRSGASNIASALMERFDLTGQREDLDEAISLNRQALEFLPVRHTSRPMRLNNLALTLATKFDQSGQQEDLDEAILFLRESLELQPASLPDRSRCMNNLGTFLGMRFAKSRQREDLDEAISYHRDALKLQPWPHPDRSMSLHELATRLMGRFIQSGQQEDLYKAISLYREALELRPAPHPYRYASLNNLALALESQFDQEGQHEQLEAALNMYNESINTLVSGHPAMNKISSKLATALIKAYSHTQQSEYLAKAMAAYRDAVMCEAASGSLRFRTAIVWAYHADRHDQPALDAYQAAIELLPSVAMLGLDLRSRQQALTSGSDGLARDAAAYAIRSGQYEKAVELLEAGRAVFWSQALQLRTPMAALLEVAPDLGDKLRRISIALEQGSLRDVSRGLSDTPQKVVSMEKEASNFRRLNNEWLATLEQVRQLDGFRDFLRPSRLSTLLHAAANGPIVVLNASKTSGCCAALILTSTGVQCISLPDLSFTKLITLVKLLRHAIVQHGRDGLPPQSNREHVESLVHQMSFISSTLQLLRQQLERHCRRATYPSVHPDNIFRFVLSVLWESAVEPVIRTLDLEKSSELTRLWWCPTGPFAFLPIHAAGMYFPERMTENVFDYVVSSYIPTIGSLLRDGDTNSPPIDSFKMIVAIQPDTPGQTPLPRTLDELQKIEDHVPGNYLVKLMCGSVKEVLSHLPTTSVAHFACHAHQNTQDPLDSALLFQDGQLKVSQIMQQYIPNGSLAFLNACETAMGDENLPDEVMHLGATLLFTGFHGVVATMWSIADPDGPTITEVFYKNLFRAAGLSMNASGPDTTQAAQALHYAVAKLRSDNVSFMRWVPFIHLGI